jgi:hypothetical protein
LPTLKSIQRAIESGDWLTTNLHGTRQQLHSAGYR